MFAATSFWVAGRGRLDHGTRKSAVSQESELIKRTVFFILDTNLGQLMLI